MMSSLLNKVFTTLFVSISALTVTIAFAEQTYSKSEKPRINELFPINWLVYPVIEPAIPANYEMKYLNRGDYTLWGVAEDLKNFSFEELSNLKEGVFAIRFSQVVQIDETNFSCTEEDLRRQLTDFGATDLHIRKSMWNYYPVIDATGLIDNTKKYNAWIGLDEPEGWVVFVQLLATGNREKDDQLWEDFIKNTRQLEERELFIAKGMDMHDGYTHYQHGTASMLVVAEKRESDNMLAVMIKPENLNTTFNLKGINEGLMGCKWKHAEPCVKIKGLITEKDGNTNNMIDTVITVLTRSVNEFSFDFDKTNQAENVVIISQQGE